MTRRATAIKWICYCLGALVLVLVQSAVLVHVRIWGVHPFILPAIAVIPATLERGEQGLLYGAFFGLACDLLTPVTGLPCFYFLVFLLGAAAAWLLRQGGRFFLVHRAERLCDLLCTLRASGLEPKRLRLVRSTSGKTRLVLLEARRGGRPGLTVEPDQLV